MVCAYLSVYRVLDYYIVDAASVIYDYVKLLQCILCAVSAHYAFDNGVIFGFLNNIASLGCNYFVSVCKIEWEE